MTIKTNILPKGINGIALWPFIFVRTKENPYLINHEKIHIRQQLELFILPFYIWYGIEYLRKGYDGICFEKEAHENRFDMNYLKTRKRFAFMKYLFFLFPILSFAQITVDLGFHQIPVEDSTSYEAVKKFAFYMERNPIDYEEAIRKVKQIKTIQADRYFVGEFKGGTITLNNRLNDFPYTKQRVILGYLAKNNGADMNDTFNITAENEKRFKRQIKTNYIYDLIVRKLIGYSPLTSKR